MYFNKVKEGDILNNPLTLQGYMVLLRTREIIIAQRTIVISTETPYLVLRSDVRVRIVLSELKLGDQISYGANEDVYVVVSNEPNCSHAIAVDMRVLTKEIATDWISED